MTNPSTAMRRSSQVAEDKFRSRLAELGAVLLESAWLGSNVPHRVRCAAGHECRPCPGNVIRGTGPCRTCAGRDPVAAEAAFRRRLADAGAEPLYDRWLGVNRPHLIRCAAGHETRPRPGHVQQGGGICRRCGAGQLKREPSLKAEAKFREVLLAMGAVPLYKEWTGTKSAYHVRCPAGHDCWPAPASVQRGNGICRICAGVDSGTAAEAFRARLAELGAIPLFGSYQSNNQPHHVRCSRGHDCWPRPHDVMRGRGICRTCARRDPAVAEAEFRARLAAIGATSAFETWLGAARPHHVICEAGHDSWTTPSNVRKGDGVCRTCAGNDTRAAEAAFRDRVRELGGTPLYTAWAGVRQPHRVRCTKGHDSYPWPSSVQQGGGLCSTCAGKAWDAFYVVRSASALKFGITSGDPRRRLADHARDGYATVVRIRSGLPEMVAPDAERAVLSALSMARERPLRGKEYFDISCLALVLDVADSYLPPSAQSFAGTAS